MTTTDTTTTIVVPGMHLMSALLGTRDAHLRRIEEQFPSVRISARGDEIAVRGVESAVVAQLFAEV